MSGSPSDITGLLRRWQAGDPEALNQLIPVVYQRLRRLAHQRLRDDGGRISLNTTGLVHEAYLRLVQSPEVGLEDRNHFLALASRVMRHVLVDQARARKAAKRGGGAAALELEDWMNVSDRSLDAVLQIDEALLRLEALDARQSQIIEQRYFGGLSLEDTASAVGVSLATVKRELRSARAWLALELRGDGAR